eukprot:scaffold5197_cov117-Isochrysis_galbana.AAC.3
MGPVCGPADNVGVCGLGVELQNGQCVPIHGDGDGGLSGPGTQCEYMCYVRGPAGCWVCWYNLQY